MPDPHWCPLADQLMATSYSSDDHSLSRLAVRAAKVLSALPEGAVEVATAMVDAKVPDGWAVKPGGTHEFLVAAPDNAFAWTVRRVRSGRWAPRGRGLGEDYGREFPTAQEAVEAVLRGNHDG